MRLRVSAASAAGGTAALPAGRLPPHVIAIAFVPSGNMPSSAPAPRLEDVRLEIPAETDEQGTAIGPLLAAAPAPVMRSLTAPTAAHVMAPARAPRHDHGALARQLSRQITMSYPPQGGAAECNEAWVLPAGAQLKRFDVHGAAALLTVPLSLDEAGSGLDDNARRALSAWDFLGDGTQADCKEGKQETANACLSSHSLRLYSLCHFMSLFFSMSTTP